MNVAVRIHVGVMAIRVLHIPVGTAVLIARPFPAVSMLVEISASLGVTDNLWIPSMPRWDVWVLAGHRKVI